MWVEFVQGMIAPLHFYKPSSSLSPICRPPSPVRRQPELHCRLSHRCQTMGQGLSCASAPESALFGAAAAGVLEEFEVALEAEPDGLHLATVHDRLSPLHIAASHGRDEVVSLILEKSFNPDIVNRHKQTPLMLAAMNGKIACVRELLQAGANILMFDSIDGRTCLHYAAYYGHSDCLRAILAAADSSPVSDSWGFARFVNIRDGTGATPLHLAARQKQAECIHILLDSGALVCASTGIYGCSGSTPLHLAARGGSLDCVRALLAWGADRLQIDSSGRIPYNVALKYKHGACASLLNPSSAEPLVWPSPLKLISDLSPEAKSLLEKALMDANREREKNILMQFSLGTIDLSAEDVNSSDADFDEDNDFELCCICFEQVCTIEIEDCGHQMCAHCTLSMCCHNKPNPVTALLAVPVCPFCRSNIARLVVAKIKDDNKESEDTLKPRKSLKIRSLSGGSSSFKGLSSLGSIRKMVPGRSSGRISDDHDFLDKP